MYKIYAINQGMWPFDYGMVLPWIVPGGTKGNFSAYFWCIKGKDSAILVDTGLTQEVAERLLRTKCYGGENYITDSLKKLDIEPNSIKTIIVTHLHSDHFSAYSLYPNATFYIQKREIEFFTGPGTKYMFVNRFATNISNIISLAYNKRVKYLDGDTEIAPGIRSVLIGGHTPGSQAVVVSTNKGEAVICGDAVDLYRNLEEVMCGPAADMLEALSGIDKIKAISSSPDLIIPSHDPLVLERFPSSIEGVAEIV
jgi:glyoxylase-like metal-dependent hydrolase (beta-lactamase superfamily II)